MLNPPHFVIEMYQNATLYMPNEGVASERDIDPWKNFNTISAYGFADLKDIAAEINADEPCKINNLNEVKVTDYFDDFAPGLYIVRHIKGVKKSVNLST